MSQISPQVISVTNSWAVRMTDTVLARYSLSRARWHYEHGLVVKAIAEAGEAAGSARYARFAQDWVDRFVTEDGNIRTYRIEEFNLDQINPGKLLFRSLAVSGSERYVRALKLLFEQLQNQPRTQSGGFWHKQIYPFQVWLDGLYMAAPFLAEYAITFQQPEILSDVSRQFISIEEQVRDPLTGLLYHGWDESRQQRWADPQTGCSPHFWGRAMGWYVMALVDVLDLLPVDHPDCPVLVEILNRAAKALSQVQDPSSGLWYQVLNLPDRPGNYLESSVSAMLVYAFARSVRNGYLPYRYLPKARRAYRGLLEKQIRIDSRGLLKLEGTCGVAGLGGKPYRDGSFEYYVKEKTVTNDFKGVGPFIMAALEMDASGAVIPEAE